MHKLFEVSKRKFIVQKMIENNYVFLFTQQYRVEFLKLH